MNIIHASQSVLEHTSATPSAVGRFQIYRKSHGGTFFPSFSTDSEAEAIEAFMFQAPVSEGGDVRLVDLSEQRMVDFVRWKIVRTEIGLQVLQRANVFPDGHFPLITCDLLKQKKIRDAVECGSDGSKYSDRCRSIVEEVPGDLSRRFVY